MPVLKVKSLRSGRIYDVYGMSGSRFLLRKEDGWYFEPIEYYVPVESGIILIGEMFMDKQTKCRGCGAPIVFVKTVAGKSMPCNPGRVPFWAKQRGSGKAVTIDGEVVNCEFEGPRSTVSGFGFVSHFSTCPNAGSFRKK